jgi:hypothetical protein
MKKIQIHLSFKQRPGDTHIVAFKKTLYRKNHFDKEPAFK